MPFIAPFLAFMAFLILESAVSGLVPGSTNWWLSHAKYWIYPLQTVVCGVLLAIYWKHYEFRPWKGAWKLGVLAGIVVLFIWISPQLIFGAAPRVGDLKPELLGSPGWPYYGILWISPEGILWNAPISGAFNPEAVGTSGWFYYFTVIMRFIRLVIVVSLLEEIFWRSFLMRYLIKEDFNTVPFGTYTRLSFFGVAGMFTMVHSQADWPAAFLTGLIYNWIAIKTKSLGACVIAHAVTNLILGFYIMATRQWGFW